MAGQNFQFITKEEARFVGKIGIALSFVIDRDPEKLPSKKKYFGMAFSNTDEVREFGKYFMDIADGIDGRSKEGRELALAQSKEFGRMSSVEFTNVK